MDTRPAPTTAPAPPRVLFLDWLRIAALGLLVPYHVGMYYTTWGWHAKSPHASALIEPFMLLTSPWRMSLLFCVAGAATAIVLSRRGAGAAWLRQRARRLLLPLAAGMLLVVPPQAYVEVVQFHGYGGSYAEFLRLYFSGYGGFCTPARGCLVLPTWNHLWFLPYLFVYSALLWLLLRRRPQAVERGGERLEALLRGARLFWLPLLVLWLLRITLGARFGITHALVDDPFAHAQFGAMFGFGVLAARRDALWRRIASRRWPALAAALAAWALWAGAGDAMPGALRAALVSTEQWSALLAAFGFAHRHLNADGAWRQRLTEAVFPVYVLHQTLIVLLAVVLAPLALPAAIEGPALVVATFALAWAGYEVVRRVPPLRPWFGLGAPRVPRVDGPGNALASTRLP